MAGTGMTGRRRIRLQPCRAFELDARGIELAELRQRGRIVFQTARIFRAEPGRGAVVLQRPEYIALLGQHSR